MVHSKGFALSLVFLVGFLMSALLTSCFGTAQKTGDEKVKITFVDMKSMSPEEWAKTIEGFNKTHPNIEVVVETSPNSSTSYHDLLTQKLRNKDTSVDIFYMDVVWPAEFASAQWAEPLDRFFTPEMQKEYMPGAITANTYEGKMYGVPAFIDSGLLYYRKDLLEKHAKRVPETWEELVQTAKYILEKERQANPNLYGYVGQFKQYEGLVCNMLEFIYSGGGTFITDTQGALSTQRNRQVMSFITDELFSIAPTGMTTYQEPESLAIFTQGNAIFHRNWPYAWYVSLDAQRSKVSGKVGIAKLPRFEGGRNVATLGGWQYGMSAYSQHKKEAWEVIKYLSSPEVQKHSALFGGYAPTRLALYKDADILAKNPHYEDLYDVFVTAIPRPRTPLYPQISNILQVYFSKALFSSKAEVITGALDEADRKITETLNLF